MFKKLFCSHDWKTHVKKEYNYSKIEIVDGTEHHFKPKLQDVEYNETVEVLICTKCGKIHKIKY